MPRSANLLRLDVTAWCCGEVLHIHISRRLIEPRNSTFPTEKLHAVGRMHGAGWYTHTTEVFQIPRMSYEEWLERSDEIRTEEDASVCDRLS
jgi:G:T-mismatch repair DNA endonuclease (very short patch repair protein)